MPGFLSEALIGLLISSLFGALIWASKHWLREEIERATYPIQKHANGGLSLPDVAKVSARTESKVDELLIAVGALQGGLSTHLMNHK